MCVLQYTRATNVHTHTHSLTRDKVNQMKAMKIICLLGGALLLLCSIAVAGAGAISCVLLLLLLSKTLGHYCLHHCPRPLINVKWAFFEFIINVDSENVIECGAYTRLLCVYLAGDCYVIESKEKLLLLLLLLLSLLSLLVVARCCYYFHG